MLVQVSRRGGEIPRVPLGETPVAELHLQPGEYVVGFEMRPGIARSERVTVDWLWVAYVVTSLEAVS